MGNANEPERAVAGLLQRWLQQSKDQGVIVLDRHGVILGWLGGAQEILGYSAQEAVGHHIAMIFTHEDRSKGYPDHELSVAARDRFSEDSRWHLRRDGTRIWVSGSVAAVRDQPGGEVQGFVKVIRDMTDQRAHMERFENEARANQQHREFLRVLGHEIRNPLSVLSNAALVLERVTTDDRGLRAMRLVGAQVDVLQRLANDLTDMGREPGKVHLELARIDLGELLREVSHTLEPVAAEKSITIETLLPPAPLFVRADTARMRQVVVNLLHNAIKYGKRDGHVWVTASEEGTEIVCRVADDGLGIFPPVLPRLFEMFSQPAGEQSEREGTPGVGLALVRQLVELHGGTVQAKSGGLGKGAEFAFRLPVDPQPGA